MAWLQSSSSSSSGVSMCREGERGRRRVGQTGTAARSRTHAAAAHNTEHTRCVSEASGEPRRDNRILNRCSRAPSSVPDAGFRATGRGRRLLHIDATGS